MYACPGETHAELSRGQRFELAAKETEFMNVTLTPQLENLIEERIKSGFYEARAMWRPCWVVYDVP